jgi:D-lactate dehydrogenase
MRSGLDGERTVVARALLAALGPERVLTAVEDLDRYATDASPYRLRPQAAVVATRAEDVVTTLAVAARSGTPVTFRAAGTSLNGQALGPGVIIDGSRWSGGTVEDGGRVLRASPGTTVSQANAILAPLGRILGPDPASAAWASVGGVVANNGSGMSCGVHHNSYRTVLSMTCVLPSGLVIDTAAPDAERYFRAEATELAKGLADLRQSIIQDDALVGFLRRKFALKNTSGYRLDAFLDATTPLEIFRRLVVGSQGTLAFIAEVVMRTLPAPRWRSVALPLYPSLAEAARSVPSWLASGAAVVELLDGASLRYAAGADAELGHWAELPDGAAGLLVELRAQSEVELDRLDAAALDAIATMSLLAPVEPSREPELAQRYWGVRANLLALSLTDCPPDHLAIFEDVCVPPDRLAEAVGDITALQRRFGYPSAVSGHAAAGNLHFAVFVDAGRPAGVHCYAAFMQALADLIVGRYGGSLKAEHGTGRNMAPFVAKEWGPRATEIMWRIKHLADPDGRLAPDVLLSRDPLVHLRHLRR